MRDRGKRPAVNCPGQNKGLKTLQKSTQGQPVLEDWRMITYNFKMFYSFFVFHLFYNLSSNPPEGEKIACVFNALACLDNTESTLRVCPIVPVGMNPGSGTGAGFGRTWGCS
jgi:hypothetical protein